MRYYYKRAIPREHFSIGFGRPKRFVLVLVIINTVIFFLESFAPNKFVYLFGLVPPLITRKFYIWQFVTYMFLHGSFWHLFFNMFTLYIFGSELEKLWGTKKFLTYYFITGIGAGLCAYVFTNAPTIGASGAIYGLLLAYGMMFPNRWLLVFFVFPMKAKYFALVFGLIELLLSIGGSPDGIAHIAHLGGMVFGLLYLWFQKKRKKYHYNGNSPIDADFTVIPPNDNENIDYILDKILQYGIDSLTPTERKKLVKAGKFFARYYDNDSRKQKR